MTEFVLLEVGIDDEFTTTESLLESEFLRRDLKSGYMGRPVSLREKPPDVRYNWCN